jgi:hypothetical protein
MRRCLLTVSSEDDTKPSTAHVASAKNDLSGEDKFHKAAKMFLRAIDDCSSDKTSVNQDNTKSFFAAYVQAHWLLKSTNLRSTSNGESNQIFCTQTWPRSLCERNANRWNDDANSNNVMCLNPAEVWCDFPSCNEARCGRQGCLRCYRFLPRDYSLSASGKIVGRQCRDRSYDMVTFVKCSWCSVSFCNKHLGFYCDEHDDDCWYQCDVCQSSSCTDCVSQVFVRPPSAAGCSVVTRGRVCGRKLCKDCSWYVGKSRNNDRSNSASTSSTSSKVISQQGKMMNLGEKERLECVEECCPQCQPQVESRMKEMELMQNSFMGFMP